MEKLRQLTDRAIGVYYSNFLIENNPQYADKIWTKKVFGRPPVISVGDYESLTNLTEMRESLKRRDRLDEDILKEAI